MLKNFFQDLFYVLACFLDEMRDKLDELEEKLFVVKPSSEEMQRALDRKFLYTMFIKTCEIHPQRHPEVAHEFVLNCIEALFKSPYDPSMWGMMSVDGRCEIFVELSQEQIDVLKKVYPGTFGWCFPGPLRFLHIEEYPGFFIYDATRQELPEWLKHIQRDAEEDQRGTV